MVKLFRRDRAVRAPATDAVAEFWLRWERLRPRVEHALDTGELHTVETQVADAVAILDRRLGWSLTGGEEQRYALVVTGEGDDVLRSLTDSWYAAAPQDRAWDYHDAAQPVDDPADVTLSIGAVQIPLSEVLVRALPDGEVLHIAVYHPLLAQLEGEDRDALSFVSLDTTLGERLVERRIGCVEPVDAEPADAMDLVQLRELVRALDSVATRTVCPTG